MTTTSALPVVPALCLVRPAVASAEDLLRLLARRAQQEGHVTPTFEEALLARERAFPTGLPLPDPAALPHADPEHVLRPGLAVALLDPPVEFGEMGGQDRRVGCGLAVLLLVTTPQAQVEVLGRVLAALQQPDRAQRLAGAADADDLASRFGALLV